MMKKQRIGYLIGALLTITILISACTMAKKSPAVVAAAEQASGQMVEVTPVTLSLDKRASAFTYYDLQVQAQLQQQIDTLKALDASMEEPLLIVNPYGTNTTGLYLYFTEETAARLQVSVAAEGYSTYTKLYDAEEETEHEHQIIGMVAGMENTITLSLLNQDDTVFKEVSFVVNAPQLASGYVNQIEKSEGTSDTSLSDGLYAALGLNFTYNGYTFLIDNDGVIRGELVLDGDMNETIEFYQNAMLLNTDETHMALIDPLGKVSAVYDLKQYAVHHDYEINAQGEAIILVSDTKKDSVEDVILSLDLDTGVYDVLIDFDDLMMEYKEMTQNFSEDSVWGSFGDTSWDWLHFNTLQLVNEDELILSSRETSTIMKFSNIYEDMVIDYFIADEGTWENTEYAQYLLNKDGSFVDTAGQHAVTYVAGDLLEEGQYYLYLFNNNYWCYESRPSYEGNVAGASTDFYTGTSYYTCYLVDEQAGTYTLVDRMEVPYSSIVSSVQWVEDNLIVNSGVAKNFQVYDINHELIASYSYTHDDLFQGYRILKYDFKGYWFA